MITTNIKVSQNMTRREEFSFKQIHACIKRKYPRETPEQIKVRIQKMYENQLNQIFNEEVGDNMSQSTNQGSLPDDEVMENWENLDTLHQSITKFDPDKIKCQIIKK